MAQNGYGTHHTTSHADFAAFDRLPAPLRQVLRYSVASWSAKHIGEDFDRLVLGRAKSPRQAAAIIARWISSVDEPEDTYRTYGPDHPEANAHGLPLSPAENAVWGQRT